MSKARLAKEVDSVMHNTEKLVLKSKKDIESTYKVAEMIMKVKEPIKPEYKLIKEDQLVFTYFHFASYKPLTSAMIKSKAVCLAYENS